MSKPNLDDKTFDHLVEEARKLIPGYSPEWTDYNLSDPGITLIDLLAWLSEIALYRTNLITDKHRLKYLQLLGVKPQPPKQAKVDLTFSSDEEKLLPKGTQVATEVNGKKIYFQLNEDINIVPGTLENILEKIVVYDSASGIYDRSVSNEKGDLFFAPFGEDIQKGCALYLGFNFDNNSSDTKGLKEKPELRNCIFNFNNNHPDTLNFMCYVYEKDLKESGKHGDEEDYKFDNVSLKWEISVKSKVSGKSSYKWPVYRKFCKIKNIRNLLDREFHLKKTKLYTAHKNLKSNLQRICDTADKFEWKPILPKDIEDQTEDFKKNGRIIFEGLEGWRSCCLFPELITLSKPYFWLRCRVEESHYEYPPRIEMLRLNTVSATHSLTVRDYNKKRDSNESPKRISNGLPGQVFNLREVPILDKTLKLSIRRNKEWAIKGDNEWVEVDDFKRSGPYDKNFVLDEEKWVIKLGDGKRGLVPPARSKIMILMYSSEVGKKEKLKGFEEWVSNGLPNQVFKLLNLSIGGEKWIQVDNFEGSGPLDKHFVLNSGKKEIKFGDGRKGLVPPRDSEIMIKRSISEYEEERNHTSKEEWSIEGLQNGTVKLSVPSLSEMRFILEDKWVEVDDFEGSGPSDKHFVLDNETGEFKFGDGLMGSVPSVGSDIEILEYVSGGGEEGNLMAECSWSIEDYNGKIINCIPSTGGKKAQTIEEAIDDFLRDLKTPYTAVTLQDFKRIAENTPGLRVAKAKAIPNQKPSNSEPTILEENSGSITVVVVPYTPLEFLKTVPKMSEGFKHAVCLHLDKHRLLGTDIYVIPPVYIKVIISATVVPMDSFRNDSLIHERVVKKLNYFLHPITGALEEKGWPIGRDVYLSELYDIIENIEGVNYVARLSISGDLEASTDTNGNLMLNSVAGVVYSGVHKVDITREANRHHNRG